ncbi:pseudouridylate synthase PUS7L [Genypterus blacodes]|uniref:pseudouridylate synthase PUS7L n=1 Tax=Genypterus blacodes TaxID=154954 RepID=UPI003F765730
MKQDADAVIVPACFISNHQGFSGSIKNLIGDFVVTEIDISGQQVRTPAAAQPPQVPDFDFPGRTRERSTECKQDRCVPVSQDSGVSADGMIDVSCSENVDLSVILGQSVCEALEQFVATLKDDLKKAEKQQLSLGSFPDKHQRANVHRAVRQRFPFLMTVTAQFQISVKEDPDYAELSHLVTDDEAEDFFRFLDAKARGSSYTFQPDNDKEHRTAVHHFISRRFGKLLETKSLSDQRGTSISVRLRERGRPKKRTADDRKEEDVYTAFTLCKENLETLEAISYMAAGLGVLPSDFTYAGIKDKRAITYQSMVVKKVSPQRLQEKTAEFEKRGIRLSHVRSVSEPLRLGRLQGNHFDLVVRNLRLHGSSDTHSSGPDTHAQLEALVEEAVDHVRLSGFVNYYGPQRFGTGQSVQSDRVGLALLKEDLVSAVRLFFTPEEGSDPPSQAKRHFLQTDNAKESLALMPMSKARERLMLRALNRYGTGPDGCTRAWLSLPHSMRVFYPHAYCSRVWNEAVAHRLATLGHSVRRGDLVRERNSQEDAAAESSSGQIHVVTDQEEQEGAYTLGQVLMPMPGNTVKYPENSMGTWYHDRLMRDGLANCRFRVGSLKLNLPGCHRPLLAHPRNLTYQLQRAAGAEAGGGATGGKDSAALTLNFNLDSSCYATVCLREIMKCDP